MDLEDTSCIGLVHSLDIGSSKSTWLAVDLNTGRYDFCYSWPTLTLTTLWADSADEKLMIFLLFFFV